jgi:hypothetical protein
MYRVSLLDQLFGSVIGCSSDINLFIIGLFVFQRLTHVFSLKGWCLLIEVCSQTCWSDL